MGTQALSGFDANLVESVCRTTLAATKGHPREMRSLHLAALATLACLAASAPPSHAAPPRILRAASSELSAARYTARNPDAMCELQKARALGVDETAALAALATLEHLADTTSAGLVERAFAQVHREGKSAEVRAEAGFAARRLSAEEGTPASVAKAEALGIVNNLVLVGPFRDTGGGLEAQEGPEKEPGFGFPDGRYAWGVYEVGFRPVLATHTDARGVPLQLYIHPRRESCSYVASKVTLTRDQTVVLRAASSGQIRLVFDGVEVGKSDDVHESALYDRLAARIEARTGPHLVAAKVCTGALDDDGRVRLRLTDDRGEPIVLRSERDLRGIPDGPGTASASASANSAKKLSFRQEETLLARSTRATARSSPDALLATIVIRARGGADDKKSPRVPGLLDALVQKDIPADALAIAAWVSPFGANRSGWLEKARRRADKGDPETLGFVQRRLVAERLQHGQGDWAMAAVRAARLEGETDDEALLLRAETRRVLGTEALTAEALHEMARAIKARPNAVPNLLLQRASTLAQTHDRALYIQIRDELRRRGERESETVRAAALVGREALERAAQEALDGGVTDDDSALDVANQLLRSGAAESALSAYKKLVVFAPNRAETFSGLSGALAQTGKASPAEIAQVLARARMLAPGESRYRAELELRTVRESQKGREDEQYLVNPDVILARRKGVAKEGVSDVADRELHWLRAVIMHPDRRVSQLIHYAREIVIAPRTQDELFEDIPQEGEAIEILRARVHRKDGRIALPTEEHNEGTRPRIRWPELYPGDSVEVAVRTWTGGPVGGRGDAPYYFIDYAGAASTHPLLYNEVIIDSAKDTPIFVDVLRGGEHERSEKDVNGRHLVRLVWKKPIIVPEEPLSPSMSEVLPVIVGSTFKTWDDFRKWYHEAVKGFTEPDDQVRRLAAELTKGKTTREDKLRAIFNFVADDIRYVNYVSGEWWLPNRPQQLLARREGDCDDKAILLITLLKAIGIEAQEVMVQTRMTGQPSILSTKNAAVPLFDHGIAFLPGPNGGTYLDATSPESRLGPLPSMDARASALQLDGSGGIVTLPSSSPDDHGSDVTWTLKIAESGAAELEGEERHTGDGGFWLRTHLTQKDARAQYVEDTLVGPWLSQVQVDKAIDFKGDLRNGQAWVRYKAKSLAYARREQGELVVPLAQSIPMASQIASLVTRTLPVSLPPTMAPSHQSRTVRLVPPPGFHFAPPPPGGRENGGEFGRAELSFVKDPKDPRALVVKRTVVLDQNLIPPEKYAAWRGFIQRIDALMHKSVRLERGPR